MRDRLKTKEQLITELRELRREFSEARKSRQVLHSLMEYIPEGITIADAPDVTIRMVSKRGQDLSGKVREVLEEERWRLFRADGITPARNEDLPLTRATRKGEVVVDEEWIIKKPDGTEMTVLCNAGPIMDECGKITGGIIAWRDITARKQEGERIENITRFPDENPNPVLRVAREGTLFYANKSSSLLLRCQAWKVGCKLPNHWHKIALDVLEGGVQQKAEVKCADILYSLVFTPVADSRYVNIYATDITEQKQIEEELRQAYKILYETLESIRDGFFFVDREWRFTYLNAHGAKALGLERKEAMGQVGWDLFPEALNRRFYTEYRRAMESNVSVHFEEFYPEPLNAWFECHGYPSPEGLAVFFRDVTERKRMEEALQESRNDLNRAQAVAHIGSWRLNVRDNELLWSDEAYRIFEVARGSSLTYETFLAAVHPEDREYVDGKWKAALRGESYDIEHRIVAGGAVKWVREKAELDFDEEGALLGGFGTVQVITERKQMEKELRKSRDELELHVQERTAELHRSNQALQEFASIASHDMQEPLRKIQKFSDLVCRRYSNDLNDEAKDYLERIRGGAKRMDALLEALLKYSRVTTRANPFITSDLNILAEDVVSDLEILIEQKGASIEIGELPTADVDPSQFMQLLQNLIANGMKYNKSEKPNVKVYAEKPQNDSYRIYVEDNGIGFDETYLDKIFQPFQRLHGRSSEFKGTGMGLAICKKIVERHGGSITARSTVGKGSTFIVTLPLERPAK